MEWRWKEKAPPVRRGFLLEGLSERHRLGITRSCRHSLGRSGTGWIIRPVQFADGVSAHAPESLFHDSGFSGLAVLAFVGAADETALDVNVIAAFQAGGQFPCDVPSDNAVPFRAALPSTLGVLPGTLGGDGKYRVGSFAALALAALRVFADEADDLD